jgi:hypothetical protein
MTRTRSAQLAAWASAWLAGRAAADDVLRATVGDDGSHRVVGLPGHPGPEPLSQLLISWRQCAESAHLLLPVPGDLRGVPGPADFRNAATDAGEAVYAGPIGVVPDLFDPSPSSAPVTVVWHAFAVSAAPPDHIAVADAQHDLVTAIRDAASALTAAGVSGAMRDITAELGAARRAGEYISLPPGHPSRAVALVAQAERLQAVLDLATADVSGGAVDRFGMSARESALRPLAAAVRRARLAGYNAAS